MKHRHLDFTGDFSVELGNDRSQAAVMVLAPGERAGGPDNRHRGSDQWLYVVSGEGTAIIDGEEQALRAQTLVLIERGEAHEIRNTGDAPLQTISFYLPPAYDAAGEEIPSGQS